MFWILLFICVMSAIAAECIKAVFKIILEIIKTLKK